MDSKPIQWVRWKQEGDTHCQNDSFLKAIECYDQALKLVKTSKDAVSLFLDRSSARISFQAFDAALSDAAAALNLPPGNKSPNNTNERGLSLTARALYGLGRFQKCRDCLTKMINLYPGNKDALLSRCDKRQREENGHYEWASMLSEAQSPNPDMDRATYIGPIEVRPCAIKSDGRGLFTAKDVEAGELLLYEKAFSTVFAKEESSELEGDDKDEETLALRAKLATIRNPSLQGGFGEPFPWAGCGGGEEWEREDCCR
ncbi:hypothetical protein ABVK25_002457 [Lepraria finkii]|uniref:Uncharacterized protein n=1 Tax=Lepraria finkii TaxID=1340010 RepID=A0ABR4BHW1_9LECA